MQDMIKYNVDYEFIDAFADENQELCDEFSVDELPHIQIITAHQDMRCVLREGVGYVPVKRLIKVMSSLENEAKRIPRTGSQS